MMRRSSLTLLALLLSCSGPAAPGGEAAPGPSVAQPPASRGDTAPTASAPTTAEVDHSFRAAPPTPRPPPEFTGPVPTRALLANGLTLLAVRQGELPIVSVAIVLRGGSATDPKDKPGLTGFLGEMLKSGTKTRSAEQLADEIETLGADLSVGVDRDAMSLEATVLVENLPRLLTVLADVLTSSAFAPQEVERVRAARLTALAQERDSPPRAASRALTETLYGDHPYGHVVLGTGAAVAKISSGDLKRHHAKLFRPGNAAITLVGNLSPDDAQAHVQRVLGAWRGAGPAPKPPGAPHARAPKIVLVPKPGAPQSHLLLGHVAVPRQHPDYFPLLLCNAVLGGQFNSRINMNLRENKGFTYGASSAFAFTRAPGPFYVSTSVRTEVTAPALAEIFKELDLIKKGTVTAEELADAKNGYVLSLPGDFQTTAGVAAMMSSLFVFDLPLDYYRTLADRLGAVSLGDVNRVAAQHIEPAALSIVVVGDEAQVKPALEQLGRGPVEMRKPEQLPAPKVQP